MFVPKAIREQAHRALAAHKQRPIRDVGGVSVAEKLIAGDVDLETVARMRRFFEVNGSTFDDSRYLQHTEANSPLVRSWMLHGGTAARTWAESAFAQAVAEGRVEADQWIELLRTSPDNIYEKLNFGAWKWEYGMDAGQAARFVAEYTKAHRVDFRFDRAFGESADAVKRALIRRVEGENPFKLLARAVGVPHLQEAARLDLLEHRGSLGHPSPNWPEFIAFFALSTHDSQAAKQIVEGTTYPWRGREPQPVMRYVEPVADYVTFFHPRGACYERNAPPGLLSKVDRLIWEAFEDEIVSENTARNTLHDARRWLAKHGHAQGVAHTLLEAWHRREWSWFLDALPLDSPVRPRFAAFAEKVEGTWLAGGL
jgi:hypothetical protein